MIMTPRCTFHVPSSSVRTVPFAPMNHFAAEILPTWPVPHEEKPSRGLGRSGDCPTCCVNNIAACQCNCTAAFI